MLNNGYAFSGFSVGKIVIIIEYLNGILLLGIARRGK